MEELASFLTPSSRLDVKLLALQQVLLYTMQLFTYFNTTLKRQISPGLHELIVEV